MKSANDGEATVKVTVKLVLKNGNMQIKLGLKHSFTRSIYITIIYVVYKVHDTNII